MGWEIAVAPIAGLVGVWLGHRFSIQAQRAERIAIEQGRWRDTAASALGKANGFLVDFQPARLVGATSGNTPEQVETVRRFMVERWDVLRDALATVSAGHPSLKVRDLSWDALHFLQRVYATDAVFLMTIWKGKEPHVPTVHDSMSDFEKAENACLRLKKALHTLDNPLDRRPFQRIRTRFRAKKKA